MTSRSAWLTCFGLAALLMSASPSRTAAIPVLSTPHNLSTSGPGPVASGTESEICIFCHTPHTSQPVAPMWNRANSGATYTPYTSSTLHASVGQPTGSSKLCLSCHDGTIALGSIKSRVQPIPVRGGPPMMMTRGTLLGTDLSNDHPISFTYDSVLASQDTQLLQPATLTGAVTLDNNGEIQCMSCHNAHDNEFGDFLVMSNVQSALCLECHDRTGWSTASHALSAATWNGSGTDPWPTTEEITVADNGCENCHQPHTAPQAERLLHAVIEEDNCYPCHNGNAASTNIQAEFAKLERHPITDQSGVHDPTETPGSMTRHVECQDCHNPHAARAAVTTPPTVPGPLEEVSGISVGGTFLPTAANTYEVCFKCHADSGDLPGPYLSRYNNEDNTRLEFQTSNPAHHAVAGTGNNADVPSLYNGYTVNSVITCTDCHGNNTLTGPAGPHGSIYSPLLERRFETTDNLSESSAVYALCYKCHNRTSILNDESFKEHSKHIQGERTPCSVCHDPHGTRAGGTTGDSTHLINFRTGIVTPNSKGQLWFRDDGFERGSCSLTCHGKDHDDKNY